MSEFTLMFQEIQQSIVELKTHNSTTLVVGSNPSSISHCTPKTIHLLDVQDNNMDITETKDNTTPKEQNKSNIIISPEDEKKTTTRIT